MQYQIEIEGTWTDIDEIDLQDGQAYRIKIPVGDDFGYQYGTYSIPPTLDMFTTNNESVTIDTDPAEGFESLYHGSVGDSVVMSFDIVDGVPALQTQLDSVALGYPPLALPMLKCVMGSFGDIVDEIYFSTTLIAGVVTVTGSFPASGDWKLLPDRVNKALVEIGADWAISKDDVTFRITS